MPGLLRALLRARRVWLSADWDTGVDGIGITLRHRRYTGRDGLALEVWYRPQYALSLCLAPPLPTRCRWDGCALPPDLPDSEYCPEHDLPF